MFDVMCLISNRFVATVLSELQNEIIASTTILCVYFDLFTNMCCICFTASQPCWMGTWNFESLF